MISAFEVYLVMQLDSILNFFTWIVAIFLVATVAGLFVFGVNSSSYQTEQEGRTARQALNLAKQFFATAMIALAINSLIPSSTTAAAMILLPKIASEKNMQIVGKEAGELYGLAKKALENLGDKK